MVQLSSLVCLGDLVYLFLQVFQVLGHFFLLGIEAVLLFGEINSVVLD